MYPTAVVYDHKQRAEQYPGPVPVSGLPNISSTPHYARPYVHTGSSVLAYGVAGRWSTDLCHCFDDPANCLTTCFCPCITFGQIAEIVNRGSPSCVSSGAIYGLLGLTGFACLFSCFNRSKLRGQYDLEEAPCVDCLVHFCCPSCALCQEYRELRNRGFDMGIGWEANEDRRRRAATQAPIMTPGMTR
ncbi:hypothetical protein I3843_05G005800 [Carya illinoinensis]|uniref:POS2 n=1 Tax=Carya illinoinensis TaxID=32201 RepID=A0A8T1QD17_CARIL|nr:protein PLANT CADMIUM RESISTANCE 2-like [Carya illinoinensis]KAG2704484.1 hypothetical protein I3760_05G005900 [Carya illinoinensis]KAG6652436.1 hypothetical protein CIPAW_05G006200 [Carya illinoinensis]KAG6710510.1 hypothetical protein I3842_05G006100 [Carya illinoinensis]KAG7976954.1 hypothetical protein I3843_05G005800 [Carya illinoinensis]